MITKAKTSIPDTIAPIFTKISPADNATSIAANSNLSITFSEKIKAGIGNITLVSGNDSRTISITDKQVKISGNKFTLNPSFDLNIDSTYKVHFDAGAIKDLAPTANLTPTIDFTFTTKSTGDKQAPILQSNVGEGTVSDNLQLIFQENIKVGKGSFTLSDGNNKIVIPADDPQVSIHDNTLIINPAKTLTPQQTYTLIAPKGVVTDLAGNKFEGLTAKAPFRFNTHNAAVAPTIVITDDKTSVTNSAILYNFQLSEASTNFSLEDISVEGGTKGAFTAISSTHYTLLVTPNANPVTVNVAAGKFTNAAGNNNIAASLTTQNNQTVDTTAPTVTLTSSVANIATDGTAVISATFSEQPKGFTIEDFVSTNGSFSNFSAIDDTHYTVVFTPSIPSNGTDSNITIAAGSYTDTTGNFGIAGVKPMLTITPTEYTTSTTANGRTENYNFIQDDGHQIISTYNYDATDTLVSSIEKEIWTGHTSQTNYSLIMNNDRTKTELYTFNNDGSITSTQYEEVTQAKTAPFNASITNVNFTIIESSSYTFNITNFGVGDSLVFSNSTITPIISNLSTTDNAIDVIYADGNVITTIHLTGISQDASITDYDSFLQAFAL